MSFDPAAYRRAASAVLGRDDLQILVLDGIAQILVDGDGPALPAIDQTTLDAIDAQLAADAAAKTQADYIAAIVAERERRMALGFDYDFTDARGIHRIGTTDLDMKGWRAVDDLANAYSFAGNQAAVIDIVTDTGATQVTVAEWLGPMKLAFAAFGQPIWAASFALQAMPNTTDCADNQYWP